MMTVRNSTESSKHKAVEVAFYPQVWSGDIAKTGDPITYAIPVEDGTSDDGELLSEEAHEYVLKEHPNAPHEVRNHTGPFFIRLDWVWLPEPVTVRKRHHIVVDVERGSAEFVGVLGADADDAIGNLMSKLDDRLTHLVSETRAVSMDD